MCALFLIDGDGCRICIGLGASIANGDPWAIVSCERTRMDVQEWCDMIGSSWSPSSSPSSHAPPYCYTTHRCGRAPRPAVDRCSRRRTIRPLRARLRMHLRRRRTGPACTDAPRPRLGGRTYSIYPSLGSPSGRCVIFFGLTPTLKFSGWFIGLAHLLFLLFRFGPAHVTLDSWNSKMV
jgi:hypothetical protein